MAGISESSVIPVVDSIDDRDFSKYSDHVTVWVDKYIGVDNTYPEFKSKFDDNLHVLKSNETERNEVDDDSMIYADQDMLEKLTYELYGLKYYSNIDRALDYIRSNTTKRIFFISSGTIGKEIVPRIADLPQIQGIYIFCGNISAHTEWANDYVDNISAMLEHQDNLLERLTRDIAKYVEDKGDRYKLDDSHLAARNCYAWAKKLLLRGQALGDDGARRLIEKTDKKIESVLGPIILKTQN